MPYQVSQKYKNIVQSLREWIRDNDMTVQQFASVIGCESSFEWKFYSRKKGMLYFSTKEAEGIERVTNGAFTADLFFEHLIPSSYELVRKEPAASHVVSVGDLVVDREVA